VTKRKLRGKINLLIPFIEKASVQKLIFISSTSVYADDNSLVSEDTIPMPTLESGKQLVAIENRLMENKNFKTTVVRFGGLIGKDRHPIRFLAGKKKLKIQMLP